MTGVAVPAHPQKSLSLRDPAGPSPGSFREGLWRTRLRKPRHEPCEPPRPARTLWGCCLTRAEFCKLLCCYSGPWQAPRRETARQWVATAGGPLGPPDPSACANPWHHRASAPSRPISLSSRLMLVRVELVFKASAIASLRKATLLQH